MSLSSPFILRPVATSLLMVAILLAGVMAYKLLPVSALPEVDYPTIQVSAFYPGASPQVMTSSITAPLERQFGQMAGLDQMTSASSSGAMAITLRFSLETSLDVAEQEVQAAINAASTYLPKDLPNPPIYSKVNPADTPIMTLALTSQTVPLPQVEDIADTRFAQKISQLPGVGLVSISGGQRPAVRVQVNPTALAAYGLTLEDVNLAINNANVNTPKGGFDGPSQSYTINANDQLLSSAVYKPLIIAYKNGAPIRLSDVASVIDSAENIKQAAWMNRTPAIILNIQRQPGANVLAVVDRIHHLLPILRSALPYGIQVSVLADRTLTIRASVFDAQFELLLSIALVIMVLFLFIRHFSVTAIPSFSVPLSLIGTFGVMYLLGFSLNNLTLMALVIATGFVVDDAIVMIENISRYIEQGETPLQAALKGAGQIGFTILSLTVSLIAVLIPLLFMSDLIGRLFREFAITLAVAILISGFVSLTLTPMLCSRLLKMQSFKKNSKFEHTAGQIQERVIKRYGISLRWALAHQPLILAIAVVTLSVTLLMLYFIPKGFFPIEDTGLIQGISEAPQSISFSAMAERQEALAKIVLQDPAVENLSSFIGIDGTNSTLNSGRMLITLKPLKPLKHRIRVNDVIQRLQLKLAQVSGITLYMQPVQDLSIDDRVTRAQYQYSLSSPDQASVAKWTQLLLNRLRSIPILQDVASDQQNQGLQTRITINRDTASSLGITALMVDNVLYDAFGQRQVSTMFTQVNQYHVVLEASPKLKMAPNALHHIYLNSSTGSAVPLDAFTQVSVGTGPQLITRQGQFPSAIISFNLARNATLGEAEQAINQARRDINIPDSIQTSFEGAAKAFQNSLANEGWLFIAAMVTVYIVLGVLYESYIHPITILSTLPSACMGALIILWLTGNSLSVIAVIGIILLVGIVMKNAILMIDFALELERINGKSPYEAIYQACLLRFRPILMTTMVSMLGAVPLAFGSGMGAELRRPMGIVIIAGLTVSQVLTLYTTPVIYLAFDKLAHKLKAWRTTVPPLENEDKGGLL